MGDMTRIRRLVLLAMSVEGEPRAAWFEPAHERDLMLAAGQGGHRLVELGAVALASLDPELAAGQLMGPGRPCALPLVRRATFDALVALPPVTARSRDTSPIAAPVSAVREPASLRTPKRTVKRGTIVLASVAADDGWWEAEVVGLAAGNGLRLRWRDFPGLEEFTRPLAHVAVAPTGGLR